MRSATETQHKSVTKVLRLAIFVYLTNILEQCFLADSHVPLAFPKPALSPTGAPGQHGASVSRALSTSHVGRKAKRESGSPRTWWSFLSRKKDNLLHRATHSASITRRGSLELPMTRSLPREDASNPRASFDSTSSSPTTRSRRFSFISDYRPSFMQTQSPREPAEERPFAAALTRIEKYKGLLSTSPSVVYSPPKLLRSLVELEKQEPERRLNGD